MALEEKRFLEIQLNHRATFIEELQYIENIRTINAKYIKEKIISLENNKSLNAKEKETLAGFHKEKLDIEYKAMIDSKKIRDEEFSRRQSDLKKILDRNINDINLGTTISSNDESLSNTERAEMKLEGDRRILFLQEKYNTSIDELEKSLNQRSRENAKDIVEDITLVDGKALVSIFQPFVAQTTIFFNGLLETTSI